MSNTYKMHATIRILEVPATHSLPSCESVLERVSDEPNAFFLWWPSYRLELYRACLAWMGNQQDAEDALSEIALKVSRLLPRHAENITNLKGWLTRLSYNHCMDRLRQKQRKRNHQVDLETMIEAGREIIANSPLPQEILLNGERSDYLCRAVTLLPAHLREVVILHFWQDKSYQQIADHFAISPSTVSKRWKQARSLLARQMRGYEGDEALVGHDDHFADQALDNKVTLNRTASEGLFLEAQALSKKKAEIKPIGAVIYCAVRVTLPVKGPTEPAERLFKRTFILPLHDKPTRVEQRLRSLQRNVQRHPTGWKNKLKLVDFCYAIGHWEEAIDGYRQLLKKRPQAIDLYLQLGQILHLLEWEEDAISVYEDALSQARQDSTRHHLHGLIAFSRGDYALAATHLTAATKLAPDNAAHWHLLGQVHLAREAYQDALRAYDMALNLNPDDLVALSESYEPLVAIGCFDDALKRVRRTYELAPHDLHAVKRLAAHRSCIGLVSNEARQETKKLIRVARKVAPQAAVVEAAHATYYLYQGKFKEAVTGLREVVEKQPLNPESWYHYALCLAQTGDSQLASEAILAALALRKNDYRLYLAACDILPHAGFISELRALIEQMLKRFPKRFRAWSSAGRALVLSGDEGGCTISAKATHLQPELANSWLEHGRTLALAGDYQQAVEALSKGYHYIPPEGTLFFVRASVWLAESYQKLGDEARSGCHKWWQEAARRAKELLRPEPASGASLAMVYYWQGRALEGLDVDAAIQAYQTALDHHLLYPARQDVLNRLSA